MAPSGAKARFRANLEALDTLEHLRQAERPANPGEQATLARWSSWGAIPDVFDPRKSDWDSERQQLQERLSDDQWRQARRTTINAHYTDPNYVQAMWSSLERLGFSGGHVLEPGCGSGTFLGMAPEGAVMTGVEMDPITAEIAQALYPDSTVRAESFVDTATTSGGFDAE